MQSESNTVGLKERKHGGAVVLPLWNTDSMVRWLHCGSKGRRTSTHTSRHLFWEQDFNHSTAILENKKNLTVAGLKVVHGVEVLKKTHTLSY
jgi:hypothetical protein